MDKVLIGPYTFSKVSLHTSKTCESQDLPSVDHISTSFSSQSILNIDASPIDHPLEIFNSLPKNKATSKIMQQLIAKAQPEELNTIIHLLLPNIITLMTDIYGNYICQTLFHNCSAEHRLLLLTRLQGYLVEIAYNSRGTHALQNLIAMMNLKEEETIYITEIKGKIVEMSKDINASHVIQRLLTCVNNRFLITREVKENIEELATDKLGVCVLKKCCNDPIIMSEVLGKSLLLMQHPYGNYAIQTVLDIWKEEAAHEFISAIQGRVSQLCLQKYSSNVMEKALNIEIMQGPIAKELLNGGKITELLQSQYGSYVLRTLSINIDSELKRKLISAVQEAIVDLQNLKLKPLWSEILMNLSR